MSTVEELIAQRAEIDRLIHQETERKRQEGVERVKAIMEEYGLSSADIFGKKAPGSKLGSAKVAPKYKNPATGETWTGRGKAPLWISGRNRDEFLIK